jgi:hypothetical protein
VLRKKDPRYLKATARATFHIEKRPATVYFYSVSPAGRAVARALTPRILAESLVGTRDAKLLLSSWPWPAIRATERREYRALVVLLAGELHKRDRGAPAASDQMPVGPYLNELPDDGSTELDDGSAPTIRENDATASAKEGRRGTMAAWWVACASCAGTPTVCDASLGDGPIIPLRDG